MILNRDGRIDILDIHDRRNIVKKLEIWSGARATIFSPNGERIVSGGADGTVRLWDTSSGVTVDKPLKGHEGDVMSVAFSPDGERIVSGGADGTVRLWDTSSGVTVDKPLKGHEGDVMSVAM